MVGDWGDADGLVHGYRLKNGDLTTIDYPRGGNTSLRGINLLGDIAGLSADADDTVESGLLIVHGSPFTLNAPGAPNTDLYSFALRHDAVGTWFDADQNSHGFVLLAR